jgi:triosephosphate isomerase
MARDAGAQLALVGHSERRHVFGETDAECARKTVVAAKFGLIPVLCVGETLAQREMGDADRVVVEQLQAVFDEIQPDADTQIVIAYEPVWAIGTGRSATPADASAMHAVIRAKLSEHQRMNPDRIPILYGGSVNRGNAKSLLEADGVDGLLVGGAWLDPEGWAEICRT